MNKSFQPICVALGALLAATPVYAQEQVSDQERQLLQQMRQTARAQGMTITPEMEQQMLQRYRDVSANIMGLQMAVQARQQATVPQPASEPAPSKLVESMPIQSAQNAQAPVSPMASSSDLTAALNAHHQARRPTVFEDARDGFKANGQLWMDPTGEIQTYGTDPKTGDVTYLISMGRDGYLVKYANVNASAAPVTLGTLQDDRERVTFSSVDGQQLGGESFVAMADGLLITRAGSMFRYVPAQRPAAQTVPAGYRVMYAQGGDVAGTGYVLAMKRAQATWSDAIGASLGRSNTWNRQATAGVFGVSADRVGLKKPTSFGSREPDFALIDSNTGQAVVVPRSEPTTDLNWNDRAGNKQHFMNAIKWFPSSIGPIAIAYGDDNASVYAIHLPTGRREIIFKRAMGINNWMAEPTSDGGIRVRAKLGLSEDEIPDVRVKFGT